MFASRDFNCCSPWRRVKKNANRMKCVWNELKPWGVFIGWGTNFDFFKIFFRFFGALTVKMVSFSVQMVEFVFKQINQEVIPHYRPPAPAAGSWASGTAWTVAFGPSAGATARSG
jgi:hypothetical protein